MAHFDGTLGTACRPDPYVPDYTPAAWPDPVPLVARRPLDPLGTQLIPSAERSLFTRGADPGTTATGTATTTAPTTAPTPAAPQSPDLPWMSSCAGPAPASVPARQAVAPLPRPAVAGAVTGATPGPQRPRALRLPFVGGGEEQRRRLVDRVRTPLLGCHRITVLGPAADVRRTGVTVALGALLAHHRPDRVIAVGLDGTHSGRPGAAPQGSLQPGPHAGGWAVGDLFAAVPVPAALARPPRATDRPAGGLEVLTVRPDLPVPALDGTGYRQVMATLSGQYPLILSDASAAADDVRRAAVELADQLVICARASATGAKDLSSLLEHLVVQGHGESVRGAVIVFSPCPRSAAGTDRPVPASDLIAHFGTRCRGVVVVPAVRRSATGGSADQARSGPRAWSALLELAALVGDALAAPSPALALPLSATGPHLAATATGGPVLANPRH